MSFKKFSSDLGKPQKAAANDAAKPSDLHDQPAAPAVKPATDAGPAAKS